MPSDTEWFLCIYTISYRSSCKVVFIHATRYRLAYHVTYTEHVESLIGRNGKVRSRLCLAVLCLSHSRVSEQSKLLRC